jgi:hypothetical protein
MTPTADDFLGAGLLCLLCVGFVLLIGAVGYAHMSRRDSADDIGPDVDDRNRWQS